mgnify:FL=1
MGRRSCQGASLLACDKEAPLASRCGGCVDWRVFVGRGQCRVSDERGHTPLWHHCESGIHQPTEKTKCISIRGFGSCRFSLFFEGVCHHSRLQPAVVFHVATTVNSQVRRRGDFVVQVDYGFRRQYKGQRQNAKASKPRTCSEKANTSRQEARSDMKRGSARATRWSHDAARRTPNGARQGARKGSSPSASVTQLVTALNAANKSHLME